MKTRFLWIGELVLTGPANERWADEDDKEIEEEKGEEEEEEVQQDKWEAISRGPKELQGGCPAWIIPKSRSSFISMKCF